MTNQASHSMQHSGDSAGYFNSVTGSDNGYYVDSCDDIASQRQHESEEQIVAPSDVTEQPLHEPDWEMIVQNSPADKDVPLFIAATERREKADAALSAAFDVALNSLREYTDDILKCASDLFHANRDKLDAAEMEIKDLFVSNEAMRSAMKQKLDESASVSQAEINRLLSKVTPLDLNSIIS